MKNVSFYHKDSGVLFGTHLTTTDDDDVALNTPPDHIAIEGHHDHLSKRVDLQTGEVVDYQPPQPSSDHEWDVATKRWRLSEQAQLIKQSHNAALSAIHRLERDVQPRLVREALIGEGDAYLKLKKLDEQIAILREDIVK